MDSNQAHPVRPRTMWLGPKRKRDLDLEIEQASRSRPCPSDSQPETFTAGSPLARPAPIQRKNPNVVPKIRQVDEDPWLTYESTVQIFGRPIFLARLRSNKAELVHIQRLEQEPSSAESLVETMHQVAHRSFPNLLEHYRHGGQDFLVWEAVELSVGQVLGSRCSIDEGALAAIVWPVLKGIKHLRGQGRVLATLSADTIFLTASGIVKIAGAEHSCQIDATEMDAATLKLMALADMVQSLMTRSSPGTKWSPEAQSLPEDLNRLSVDELLRSKFFEQLGSGGELKMLVNVVNKDACHEIDFLGCA